MGELTKDARVKVLNSAIQQGYDRINNSKLDTTRLELHQRLCHISYDTIERMAASADSGIRLTSRARPNCLTCAQSKQSNNNRSKKDTGKSAPSNHLGDVIGSDIKGPMIPQNWRGIYYINNLVEYSTTTYVYSWHRKTSRRPKIFNTSWFTSKGDLIYDFTCCAQTKKRSTSTSTRSVSL